MILTGGVFPFRQPNNISVEKVGNVVAESVQLQNNKEPPQESPKKHNTGPVHPQELTNALNKLISKASISADSTSSEIVYNNPRLVNDGHPLAESESEKPAHEVDNKTWDDNMGKVKEIL